MENRKQILCLDGGGIRGLAVAHFLNQAELEFGRRAVDVFDLFSGTSIGAIVTMTLVANRMSAKELIDIAVNKEDIETIFDTPSLISRWTYSGPKHTGLGKRKVIDKWIPHMECKDLFKPICIPTYDYTNATPKLYGSFTPDVAVRDIVDASSAAPLYFPPVKMPLTNNWEGDGGIFANNPSMIGILEGKRLWGDFENIHVLSIGTGIPDSRINGEEACGWGPLSWYNHNIIDIIMNSPMSMVKENCNRLIGDRYVRIDADLKEYNVSEVLDDYSDDTIKKIDQMGVDMFQKNRDIIAPFFTSSPPS